jgi:hypothetical protein
MQIPFDAEDDKKGLLIILPIPIPVIAGSKLKLSQYLI